MNASDTRGKKALDTIIKESLSNVTVTGMLQGEIIPFQKYNINFLVFGEEGCSLGTGVCLLVHLRYLFLF